jgi:GNAT superfamily N-acetyltransferase
MLPEGNPLLDHTSAPRHGFRVLTGKVITPGPEELFIGVGKRSMKDALAVLDQGVREKRTAQVTPGIQARVVAANGVNAWVAGYEPDGRQVGYGHITLQPRYCMPDLLGYESEYVVASDYQRRGIGFAMKQLLETYAASMTQLPQRGIGVLSTIRAEHKHTKASRTLLEKLGAVPVDPAKKTYRRILLRPEEMKAEEIAGVIAIPAGDILPNVSYTL